MFSSIFGTNPFGLRLPMELPSHNINTPLPVFYRRHQFDQIVGRFPPRLSSIRIYRASRKYNSTHRDPAVPPAGADAQTGRYSVCRTTASQIGLDLTSTPEGDVPL